MHAIGAAQSEDRAANLPLHNLLLLGALLPRQHRDLLGATDDPAQAIFSSQGDMDSLSERNNVAVTMFLATPRCYTSSPRRCRRRRTTTMDKFVLVNLFINPAVAAVSWVSAGVFFKVDNNESRLINLVAFCVLLFVLLTSSVVILGVPMVVLGATASRGPTRWATRCSRSPRPVRALRQRVPAVADGHEEPGQARRQELRPRRDGGIRDGQRWGVLPASSGHPLAGGGGDDGDALPVDAHGIKMKVDTRANQKVHRSCCSKKTGSVVAADV